MKAKVKKTGEVIRVEYNETGEYSGYYHEIGTSNCYDEDVLDPLTLDPIDNEFDIDAIQAVLVTNKN